MSFKHHHQQTPQKTFENFTLGREAVPDYFVGATEDNPPRNNLPVNNSSPRQCDSRPSAPGTKFQYAPMTICPRDIMPRRQSAPGKSCPEDNLLWKTTCPGDKMQQDNMPQRLVALKDNVPQKKTCP